MLDVLYNDLPTDELDFELTCESAILRADRGVATYRAICEKAELDLREAELACIQESGDMDTLEDLYMEAEEKTGEKKTGVLSSIWKSIQGFFQKIIDFFTGKKKNIDPDSKGQIKQGTDNFFKRGVNAIRNFFTKVKNAIKEHKIAAIAIAAVTTLGGFVAIKHVLSETKGAENEANKAKDPKESEATVTIDGKTAQKYLDVGDEICEEAKKLAQDLAAEKIDDPAQLSFVNKLVTTVGNTVKSKMGEVSNKFDGLKSKFSKKNTDTEETDNNTTDSNANPTEEQNKTNDAQPETKTESVLDMYDDDSITLESSYGYDDDGDDSYYESGYDDIEHLIDDLI